MGFFQNDEYKKVYTEKEMKWEKFKNSKVMEGIMANKTIAGILDKWSEQKEFYALLRSKATGGVTRKELRQILGELRRGGGKTIDAGEAMKIAHELFPGRFTERYDYTPDANASSTNRDVPAFGFRGRVDSHGSTVGNAGARSSRQISSAQSSRPTSPAPYTRFSQSSRPVSPKSSPGRIPSRPAF